MTQASQVETRLPADVLRLAPVAQAANGVCFASLGETALPEQDLGRIVGAVPRQVAAALDRKAYYFVPLTVGQGDETLIAERYDEQLSEQAVCHRNLNIGDAQCVFISTRLMSDKFSVAFEFYINVAHAFVDKAGVSQTFSDVVLAQADNKVRGESSLDTWELRQKSAPGKEDAERHKTEYLAAAFSDAIAIYMLSLFIDFDYAELREREYPLLAPSALAERLKKVAELFPPNPGFEFNVLYRRRM
jgi:hypothetical protein